MNTYHAHLLPWLNGGLVVSVSQNARNMPLDAWNRPDRYRPQLFAEPMPPLPPPPPPPPTTTTTTTTTMAVEQLTAAPSPASPTTAPASLPATTIGEPTTTTT